MGHRVVTASAKGGVSKTSTVVGLAGTFAARGKRALVVDLDMQVNATLVLDPVDTPEDDPYTVVDAFANGDQIGSASAMLRDSAWSETPVIRAAGGAVELLAGDPRFRDGIVETYGVEALRESLKGVDDEHEISLFDTPPSTGLVVQAGLVAGEHLLVVCEPQHLSVVGVGTTMAMVEEYNQFARSGGGFSPINVVGILVSRYVPKQLEHAAALHEVKHEFGDLVFETVVPMRAVVQRAMAAHMPVHEFPGTTGAEVTAIFNDVADELSSRIER